MQQTTNLHLQKPEYTDPRDIAVINGNMDILDDALMTTQGVAHAGEFMVVDSSGAIVPTPVALANGVSF